MPVPLTCPACRRKLQAPDHLAGKRVKCPACAQVLTVGVEPRSIATGAHAAAPETSSSEANVASSPAIAFDFLGPPAAPGELGRLGRFRVLKVLGQGGMGVVFQAEDDQLKRLVALKVMQPSLAANPVARERFLREARAAAAVEHDHIVAIHQVDEANGVPFLAMPFLKGETLHDRLQRDSIPPVAETLRIGREVAEGLAAAHASGLIHRDIKPNNLWLEAGRGRVKIVDFGLARAARDEAGLTNTGAILGTPAFMAPEQARGDAVDGRCDLFSLGCVLYRMATGAMPFAGTDTISILWNLATTDPPPPSEVNPRCPAALSDLIQHLLVKDPSGRLGSAHEVVEAIRAMEQSLPPPSASVARPPALAAMPVSLASTPTLAPAEKARGSRRWILALAAGVPLLLVLGGVAFFAMQPKVPERTEPIDLDRTVKTEPVTKPSAEPLTGPAVFVTSPAALPGVTSWTVLPRDHLGPVTVAAYRPDGRLVATGGHDATVCLWEPVAKAMDLKRVLLGHTRAVTRLAWSPDGKTLASASDDSTVRLWEAETGRAVATLKGHTAGVLSLAWSRDGSRLASGGADATVCLWDVPSAKLDRAIRGLKTQVRHLAWRPGDKALVCFHAPANRYCVLDAATGVVLRSRAGAGHWAWSPDYKLLAVKAGKTIVEYWDAEADTVIRTLTLREQADEIASLAWSPDGRVLATGEVYEYSSARPAYFWDAETGKLLHKSDGTNNRSCAAVVFSPDGKLLISAGSYEYGFPVYEVGTGKRVHYLRGLGHSSRPHFSPDGKAVWGSTENPAGVGHTLVFWDTATAARRHISTGNAESQCVAWSPDGGTLATLSRQWQRAQVRLWDVGTGQVRRVYNVPRNEAGPCGVAWSPEGKLLAAATGADVEVRDATTGATVRRLTDAAADNARLGWSPDGKTLATFGKEGWLWDAVNGKPLRPLQGRPMGHVLDVAWSPDGKTLATGNRDWPGLDLWDVETGKHRQRLQGHKPRVTAVAWSPDGRLASGGEDATARLWDADGKPLLTLKDPNQGPVTAVTWLAGGKAVATLSATGTVCVFDAESGKLLRSAAGVRGTGRFSPDGRLVASTGDVEGVRLWEAETGRARGALVFLRVEEPNLYLTVTGDGHYRTDAARRVEREVVYVAGTDRGLEVFTPEEFAKASGWANDPEKARLTGR